MTPLTTVLTIASVLAIASGQILFKMAAKSIEEHGQLLHMAVLTRMLIALSIYGIATLAWVHVLRTASLSLAYPYMALSFVIVPTVSYFLFNEPINATYMVGIMLILAGILVISRAI